MQWLLGDAAARRRSISLRPRFPEGIAFDGNAFSRTALTAPAFSYLRPTREEMKGWFANRLVPLIGIAT
jgi:hypothetical protein